MKITSFIHEFITFGVKQARACIFAGSFFVLLFLSHYITFGLPRYDFIFLGAILIQIILVATKLETKDEVKVIAVFHIIGFALEAFKTHPAIGSWSYPEFGYFKLFNVPLYSGFMYAAIGSYISQSWKIMKLKLINMPKYRYGIILSILVYLNFFTHHFLPDIRYILMIAILITFWKTKVRYIVTDKIRKMPLVLSFFLIAFFIWIAENLASYLGAWKYPDQLITWTTVSLHKIGAWSLLIIISILLIANLKELKRKRLE